MVSYSVNWHWPTTHSTFMTCQMLMVDEVVWHYTVEQIVCPRVTYLVESVGFIRVQICLHMIYCNQIKHNVLGTFDECAQKYRSCLCEPLKGKEEQSSTCMKTRELKRNSTRLKEVVILNRPEEKLRTATSKVCQTQAVPNCSQVLGSINLRGNLFEQSLVSTEHVWTQSLIFYYNT